MNFVQNNPRVTVLMSVYNAEDYVAEAVDSVLGQTFDDFEFLIFEDKSTDRSLEILRSYSDSRIRLIENSTNLGLTINLVEGMRLGRGEFIARMDADDICMPERLKLQVDYMDNHLDVGVLGTSVAFFCDNKQPFVAYQPLEHEEIKCQLFFGYTMLHPSVMLRKAAFESYGLNYDKTFRVSQDHDLWCRAIQNMRFANLHDPLLKMREHEKKIGKTQTSAQKKYSNVVRKRCFEELGVNVDEHTLDLFVNYNEESCSWDKEDCVVFENLLLKVFESNKKIHYFDQDTLENVGSRIFREVCRKMMLSGNANGRYYWRSKIKSYDKSNLREKLGLLYRSTFMGN